MDIDSDSQESQPHCSSADQVLNLLRLSGVPPCFLHASIEAVEPGVRTRLQEVLRSPRKARRPNGVLLLGNTGVGKTFAMSALASHLLRSKGNSGIPLIADPVEPPILWVSVSEAVAEWKSMGMKCCEQERLIQRYFRAKLLFLDDLGSEAKDRYARDSDKGRCFIERVIRYRYDHYQPTSLTSNCNAEALILRYGAPVVSRLQHMCLWLEFPKGSRDLRLPTR